MREHSGPGDGAQLVDVDHLLVAGVPDLFRYLVRFEAARGDLDVARAAYWVLQIGRAGCGFG